MLGGSAIVMSRSFKRILIIGPTGSGKTTLAVRLSRLADIPHIQLDLLRYESDWHEVSVNEFRDRVIAAAKTDCWIIDGNYSAVRDITWSLADLVVWLDYPLSVVLWRLLTRTIHRLVTTTKVGNGNREQLRRLFGRRSIILWAIRSHSPLRKEYELKIEALRSDIPHVIRHRSPREAEKWVCIQVPAIPGWLVRSGRVAVGRLGVSCCLLRAGSGVVRVCPIRLMCPAWSPRCRMRTGGCGRRTRS